MTKGGSLILIVIIVFTFPIWIGLAGGIFGLIGGIFGLIGGIIGAVFGIIGSIFGAIFDILFGWGPWDDWDHHWHPHFHWNAGQWLLVILIVALLIRRRSSRT